MAKIIDVVYENGVFKPLEKVNLPQGVRIRVEIKEELGVLTEVILKRVGKSYRSFTKGGDRLRKTRRDLL